MPFFKHPEETRQGVLRTYAETKSYRRTARLTGISRNSVKDWCKQDAYRRERQAREDS